MTLTKTQAGLGLATAIIAFAGAVTGLTLRFTQVIERLDTRLGKLESAIKALNAVTSDENYRTLIKELMTQETSRRSQLVVGKKSGADGAHRFGTVFYPADAGAAADAPAVKVPQ